MNMRTLKRGLAACAVLLCTSFVVPAHAGSVTFVDPSCASFSQSTPDVNGNFTFTCQSLLCMPTANPQSPIGGLGLATTLTANCQATTGDQVNAWQWAVQQGSLGLCAGLMQPVTTPGQLPVAGPGLAATCTYTVTGTDQNDGKQSAGSIAITWGTVATPTCSSVTITTPSSGSFTSAGGTAVLNAHCAGNPIDSYIWTVNTTDVSDGGGVSGSTTATMSDLLPANTSSTAQTYDFQVRACNVGGCSSPKTAKMTVTVNGTSGGGVPGRTMVISTQPCDFNWQNPTIPHAASSGNGEPSITYTLGTNKGTTPRLEVNTTYYINISDYLNGTGTPAGGTASTCQFTTCDMKVQVGKPQGQ